MADGSGADMAQQVSIEADRLSGTVKDGMEAAEAASKTYGSMVMDAYARLVRSAMRNNVDFGNHTLALMQLRTPADAFKLNLEFIKNQLSSMPGRFFEIMGVSDAESDKVERSDRRASRAQPRVILDGAGRQD